MENDVELEEEKNSDWYNDSDTSEDIPDPNLQDDPLFQKVDTLPEELCNKHFEEGLIYVMTLNKQRDKPLLIMVIESRQMDFSYRTFFVRGSSRKTYHQGGTDETASYGDIWRLAPRDELVIEREISTIFIGQTLRLRHGMDVRYETILVTHKTSKTITGTIECGPNRGKAVYFKSLRSYTVRRFSDLRFSIAFSKRYKPLNGLLLIPVKHKNSHIDNQS